MITAALSRESATKPSSRVNTPVKIKLSTIVRFGPSRSDTQPPTTPDIGPYDRERAVKVFAQLASMPRSLTR